MKFDIGFQKQGTITKIDDSLQVLQVFRSRCAYFFMSTSIAEDLHEMIINRLFPGINNKDNEALVNKLHLERTTYYHTPFHCVDVAARALVYFDKDSLLVSKIELISLMLAGFYHDVGHSLGKYDDKWNTDTAIKAFEEDVAKYSQAFKNISEIASIDLKSKVIGLIRYSQYPYMVEGNLLGDTFRFLDVLQSTDSDGLLNICGLYTEMKSQVTIEDFIKQCAMFVHDFKYTGYFKDANKFKFAAHANLLDFIA